MSSSAGMRLWWRGSWVADDRDASDRPRSKGSGRMCFPVVMCEIVLCCSTLEGRKSGCAD